MAELIDKVALYDAMTEEYKKHYAGTGKGYDFTIAMHMVIDTPATTEAEIIEKFAEKLGEEFSEHSSEIEVDGIRYDILTLDGVIEIMWDLAEQLKERKND